MSFDFKFDFKGGEATQEPGVIVLVSLMLELQFLSRILELFIIIDIGLIKADKIIQVSSSNNGVTLITCVQNRKKLKTNSIIPQFKPIK